jgi:hypothetical protein
MRAETVHSLREQLQQRLQAQNFGLEDGKRIDWLAMFRKGKLVGARGGEGSRRSCCLRRLTSNLATPARLPTYPRNGKGGIPSADRSSVSIDIAPRIHFLCRGVQPTGTPQFKCSLSDK